jgi:hypothetical protein
MTLFRRTCRCCHRLFRVRPQTPKQKTCSRRACQKRRHRKDCISWRKKNPTYDNSRRPKKRGWAKGYPDYWRHYRVDHPDYVARERERMRRKRHRGKRVANRDAWRKTAVEKLSAMAAKSPETVANRDACHRRWSAMLNFLIWKEGVANQDASPRHAAVANNRGHERRDVGHDSPPL